MSYVPNVTNPTSVQHVLPAGTDEQQLTDFFLTQNRAKISTNIALEISTSGANSSIGFQVDSSAADHRDPEDNSPRLSRASSVPVSPAARGSLSPARRAVGGDVEQ